MCCAGPALVGGGRCQYPTPSPAGLGLHASGRHLPSFTSQTCPGRPLCAGHRARREGGRQTGARPPPLPGCRAPSSPNPSSPSPSFEPASLQLVLPGRWAWVWAPGPRPASGWRGSPAPPCDPTLLLPSPSLPGPSPLAPSSLALPSLSGPAPLPPGPSHSWSPLSPPRGPQPGACHSMI